MSLPYPEDVTIEVLNDADPELLLFETETEVEVLVGTTLETFDEAVTEVVEITEAVPLPVEFELTPAEQDEIVDEAVSDTLAALEPPTNLVLLFENALA